MLNLIPSCYLYFSVQSRAAACLDLPHQRISDPSLTAHWLSVSVCMCVSLELGEPGLHGGAAFFPKSLSLVLQEQWLPACSACGSHCPCECLPPARLAPFPEPT